MGSNIRKPRYRPFKVGNNLEERGVGDPSAIVELEDTDGGFLTTRLTTAQRDAIPNPGTGLLIYNSTTNQFEHWDGGAWVPTAGAGGAVSSVFGRIGAVVAATSDYDAVQVDVTPSGNLTSTDVQAALEELQTDIDNSGTELIDGDGDTYVRVEETVDEDIIRMRLGDAQHGGDYLTGVDVLVFDATDSTGFSIQPPAATNGGGLDGISVSIRAGDAENGAGGGVGGLLLLEAGSPSDGDTGGTVEIRGGSSPALAAAEGGPITVIGGAGDGGADGGSVSIAGGTDGGGGGVGGSLNLNGGDATGVGGSGGNLRITGGNSTLSNGGSILISPGNGTTEGNIELIGASNTTVAELRFQEAGINGGNWVGLQSPANLTQLNTFTLPGLQGDAGQAMVTDGAGNNLSFASYTMGIGTETSGNFTATINQLTPVNVSGGTSLVLPPVAPQAGDRFAISDSRENAATNNITIDFGTGGVNFHANGVATHVISTNRGYADFLFLNATVGWILIS